MSSAIDTMGTSPVPNPSAATQTIGKRKRSIESTKPLAADGILGDSEISETKRDKFHGFLDDLLEVLKSYDLQPSVLGQSVDSTEDESRVAKRTKLESTPSINSITSKLATHSYGTIDELNADIKAVVTTLAAASGGQARAKQLRNFENRYMDLVAKEVMQNPDALVRSSSSVSIKEEDKVEAWPSPQRGSQTVLTLHGGLSGGRQLFSSMKHAPSENLDPLLFSSPPENALSEAALPNGISITTIVPSQIPKFDEKDTKIPTLGELCPMPSHLPKFDPPKPSSQTTTRGNTVGWYKPDIPGPPKKPERQDKQTQWKESYTNQPLSVGQWLSYNVPPAASTQTTGEKRKQRDRALSTGEPHPELSAEDAERTRLLQEAHQQQRDAELFKSVYSSFAPSHDNSAAVVPQQVMSKLWWHKFGQYRYRDQLLPEDVVAFEEDGDASSSMEVDGQAEELEFKAAVDAYELVSDSNELAFQANQAAISGQDTIEKDIEEILQEISGLLETLNSYQRNRHMSLATTTQTSAGQNKPLTELAGSPKDPSENEIDVYNMLKDQLTLMISSLPPYAVAKLDSDQLGNLNVSTKIRAYSVRYKGLIQDESSKQQQMPVSNIVAPAIPPRTVPVPRPGPYPPATATPAHRNQYSAPRPSASAFRQSAPSSNYSTYNSPQTAPPGSRQSYQPQYPQAPTPAQMAHFGNGTRATMVPNGLGGHNGSAGSPIPPRHVQYPQQRPNAPAFQPRPPHTPGFPNSYTMGPGRHTSPQASGQMYPIQRPPQTPTAQAGHSISQGSPPRVSSFSGLATNGVGSNASHGRTPEEQNRLMMEQRKRIEQSNASARASSGTPQPANGQSPSRPQSNGTPRIHMSASPVPQQVNGDGGM